MWKPVLWSLAALSVLPLPAHPQNHYVGAKACARCHDSERQGSAFRHWQTSKHAEAYRALTAGSESTPRKCGDLELWIVEVGRGVRYGLPRPAAESKECLPCHVTAFGVAPKQLAASFDPKDGVQCESCHGPGSAHVESRTANGGGDLDSTLKTFGDERAIRAQCTTCHEGTCGDFDFASMWPTIRHSPAGDR